ncbi:MAG: AAA-like domain-containing protein, partial [Thermodesulfobacteriota bacterium]|nr:AAA-like domain-containing protein [Thermodesulfobacteriota bacterium]
MRNFHSYGPVDCELHFCVPRQRLVEEYTEHLVGHLEKGGHYFTIWAPRQTGKTWLMRQVKKRIEEEYGDRFVLGTMSMQGVVVEHDDPVDRFLDFAPRLMLTSMKKDVSRPSDWDGWTGMFLKEGGVFDRPVILFIDEFDSLPPKVIDRLVTLFRDMYLNRESYLLHGLALIGVRAVLGVESERGSPFNIQRSLHVPNFTREEVHDLFGQYVKESGQEIAPDVLVGVYEKTRGQPGLVGWFGELLTEKYNPGAGKDIDWNIWQRVYRKAIHVEWNNTVLNLVKKVRTGFKQHVLELFSRSDIQFSLDADWCSYLYLNGVIDSALYVKDSGEETEICRFSSPFVQKRLYNALTYDLVGDRMPILALEPLDELKDVFEGAQLNLPALLKRYRDYLIRLKAKGLNPWKEQPRRADMHLTEAVGHFHLYAWLNEAVEDICVISPEFPTGNGKVDLHLRCGDKRGIIEVKSFKSLAKAKRARV